MTSLTAYFFKREGQTTPKNVGAATSRPQRKECEICTRSAKKSSPGIRMRSVRRKPRAGCFPLSFGLQAVTLGTGAVAIADVTSSVSSRGGRGCEVLQNADSEHTNRREKDICFRASRRISRTSVEVRWGAWVLREVTIFVTPRK